MPFLPIGEENGLKAWFVFTLDSFYLKFIASKKNHVTGSTAVFLAGAEGRGKARDNHEYHLFSRQPLAGVPCAASSLREPARLVYIFL